MIRLNERYTDYLGIRFHAPVSTRFRLARITDFPPNFHVLSNLTFHRFFTPKRCLAALTLTHTHFSYRTSGKLWLIKRNNIESKLWNEQDKTSEKSHREKSGRQNMRFNASIIGCVGTISGSIVHVNIHVAKETRTRTFPAKYKGNFQ